MNTQTLKAKDAGEFADYLLNMLLCYYLHTGDQTTALRSCSYRFAQRTASPIVGKVAFGIGVAKDPLSELQKRLDMIFKAKMSLDDYIRLGLTYGRLGERPCVMNFV